MQLHIAKLTQGCIPSIVSGSIVSKPVLQIVGTKQIGGDKDRYRLLVSDGQYLYSYVMLASQLNHLLDDNKLNEHSIIRVDKYTTALVNNHEADNADKRVIILLNLTILNDGLLVGHLLGEPKTYNA